MARDPGDSSSPSPPQFAQIERAGQEAAREMAQILVNGAVRSGGTIDEAVLDRAGPDVRRVALDIMASLATADHRTLTQVPLPPLPEEPTAPRSRIDKNWADQRRPAFDPLTHPVFVGLLLAAIVGAVAVWGIHISGL